MRENHRIEEIDCTLYKSIIKYCILFIQENFDSPCDDIGDSSALIQPGSVQFYKTFERTWNVTIIGQIVSFDCLGSHTC